ncbi:MAG TPA: HAD-IA family hydrolase [Candidatus Saccharimonadales bacterium]|jgi:epoxide hydrolase-like predicted phosphatase
MVKAIIFDYFGVISSDEYWNLVKTDKNVTSDFLNMANRVNLGSLHWKDFMQMIADRTGQTLEQVKAMYSSERINPQVVALAKELHENYMIGMITNAHHEFLEPIIEKVGLEEVFDAIIISSKVGYIKPDKRIFDIALKELGVTAGETIFIDDIERNIAGAEVAGIKSIHYKSFKQLKQELEGAL